MTTFNANIVGSNAYFFKKRGELESLMDQEGMCTTWFTLSAADNHWNDLSRIACGDSPIPNFSTEKDKAKWQRKLVRNNPHLVDACFCDRAKYFLNTFFSKKGLELK